MSTRADVPPVPATPEVPVHTTHSSTRPPRRSSPRAGALGQLAPAVRVVLVLTVLLGLAYPLVVTGLAQVVVPGRADGSLVSRDGRVVGSSLIGQAFTDPAYFQGRPSAAGEKGYDPQASGASNLGLDNPDLVELVAQRRAEVARRDGVAPADVAPDALLASGSGLDPQISPEYAAQQVARVARQRDLPVGVVRRLVAEHTSGRTLGSSASPGSSCSR